MRRIVLPILCILVLSAIFFSNLPSASTQFQSTDEIVGAYNHLTLCFAFVRNGLQIKSIRRDILGNVNLASVPAEIRQLYKSLLEICDKAVARQQEIAQIESSLVEQTKRAEARQTAQLVSTLLGNPAGIISLIFSGRPGESQQSVAARSEIEAIKTAITQEVSGFEFQLSLEKDKLSLLGNARPKEFITTADIDEYLELEYDENVPERYYSALALLYQRSPAMYFVAYELGSYAFLRGQLADAQQYFASVVENTPAILKYNPIRVDAHCFLGDILAQETEYHKALDYYSKALLEDRGSAHALSSKALALHVLGQYPEAKPVYETLLRIQPDDPTTRYNYACLLALDGTGYNLVLEQLKRAFNSGFTEVAHAKFDPDLSSVRELEQFKELTQIKIGYEVDWNALKPDILRISNRSQFHWTNIFIKVNFLEDESEGWKTIIGENGILAEGLNRGELFNFEAFNSTKNFLNLIELILETEQGSLSVRFRNNLGHLEVVH